LVALLIADVTKAWQVRASGTVLMFSSTKYTLVCRIVTLTKDLKNIITYQGCCCHCWKAIFHSLMSFTVLKLLLWRTWMSWQEKLSVVGFQLLFEDCIITSPCWAACRLSRLSLLPVPSSFGLGLTSAFWCITRKRTKVPLCRVAESEVKCPTPSFQKFPTPTFAKFPTP